MANRKFWLGMLVLALVFGMTVVGCGGDEGDDDDDDDRPFLSGHVELDNYYPAIGETITASFSKWSGDPDPIGTPSWAWYKTNKNIGFVNDVENETFLGSGTTYTVHQSDEGFTIWVLLRYSGNKGFNHASTLSTVVGIPATATVSVSIEADYSPSFSYHSVTVTLTLSDGKWEDVSYDTASQWIAMSGTPSVASWYVVGNQTPSVYARGRELEISYNTINNSGTALSISNLTATLNTAQLSTMRSSTNVYNTLTAGTSSTASVSQWTIK